MSLQNLKIEETNFIKTIINRLTTKGYYQLFNSDIFFAPILHDNYKTFHSETGFSLIRDKIASPYYFTIQSIEAAEKEFPDNKTLKTIEEFMFLRNYFYEKGIGLTKISMIKEELIKLIENIIPSVEKIEDLLYNRDLVKPEIINKLDDFIKSTLEKELDKNNVYFRGQQKVNFENIPSIFRNKNWILHESDFIHEMMIHNPDEFTNCHTTIEQLTKMQHYQVPTRLLDLTRNPLVALYFACENPPEKGTAYGEVVLFKGNKENIKFYDSNSVSILSNIAKLEEFDIKKLQDLTKLEKNYISEFNEQSDLFHKCLFVHVKQDNKRIQNQQGLFLLFGTKKEDKNESIDKTKPADCSEYYYKSDKGKKLVYIIKNQKQILKELEKYNINKGFIYPEIDDYAAYLKTSVYPAN